MTTTGSGLLNYMKSQCHRLDSDMLRRSPVLVADDETSLCSVSVLVDAACYK